MIVVVNFNFCIVLFINIVLAFVVFGSILGPNPIKHFQVCKYPSPYVIVAIIILLRNIYTALRDHDIRILPYLWNCCVLCGYSAMVYVTSPPEQCEVLMSLTTVIGSAIFIALSFTNPLAYTINYFNAMARDYVLHVNRSNALHKRKIRLNKKQIPSDSTIGTDTEDCGGAKHSTNAWPNRGYNKNLMVYYNKESLFDASNFDFVCNNKKQVIKEIQAPPTINKTIHNVQANTCNINHRMQILEQIQRNIQMSKESSKKSFKAKQKKIDNDVVNIEDLIKLSDQESVGNGSITNSFQEKTKKEIPPVLAGVLETIFIKSKHPKVTSLPTFRNTNQGSTDMSTETLSIE